MSLKINLLACQDWILRTFGNCKLLESTVSAWNWRTTDLSYLYKFKINPLLFTTKHSLMLLEPWRDANGAKSHLWGKCATSGKNHLGNYLWRIYHVILFQGEMMQKYLESGFPSFPFVVVSYFLGAVGAVEPIQKEALSYFSLRLWCVLSRIKCII